MLRWESWGRGACLILTLNIPLVCANNSPSLALSFSFRAVQVRECHSQACGKGLAPPGSLVREETPALGSVNSVGGELGLWSMPPMLEMPVG